MKGVDLYARVRRAVYMEGMSQRGAARHFGIDPRTVAKMMRYSVPPGSEETLFDHIRSDLQISPREFFTSRSLTDLDDFTRVELRDRVTDVDSGPTFLQRHNPIIRHTVLRKRSTLEARGLLDRIAVDIWPHEGVPLFQCSKARRSEPQPRSMRLVKLLRSSAARLLSASEALAL